MVKFKVSGWDETATGSELLVVQGFECPDEADKAAREMSRECDWVQVWAREDNSHTYYINGVIAD